MEPTAEGDAPEELQECPQIPQTQTGMGRAILLILLFLTPPQCLC